MSVPTCKMDAWKVRGMFDQIWMVKVVGTDRGTVRTMTFFVTGLTEDAALVNAANLQRVRVLDSVHSVSAESV